ncbi:MAG: peptidoglycan-binding protein [Acetobacterales bacterium]
MTAIAAGILLAVLVGAVTLWTNPQIMPVMASIPFVDVPPGAAEPEPAPENRQEWSPGYGDRPGDVVESGDRQQTEAMGRPIEIAPRFLSEAGRDSGPSASPIAPPPAPAPASEQSEDAAVASIAPTADSPTPDAPPVRLARRLPNAAGPAQSTAVNPARPDSGASSPAPAAASPQPETRPAPAQAVAKPQQEDLIARVIAALNERANARAAAESVAQGRPVTEVTASGDLIATVQRELQARGLEPGPVDGKVGPRTREAVRAFQQRMGIEPTGDIDRPTLVQLGLL